MRFGETIQIVRDGARDRFGDRPGTPASVTVKGVGFAFVDSSSIVPQDGGDRGVAEADLYLPDGTDIAKGDKVIRMVDGSSWDVFGAPAWQGSVHPWTGWSSGVFTQRVRRVT